MHTRIRALLTLRIVVVIIAALEPAPLAAAAPSPGFLVIAPDRRYLGNEEIKAAWTEFRKAHLTRLVFISLAEDYEREVQARLEGAIAEMRREGAKEIVLIPFVLSEEDPHLKKARDLLAGAEIRIAPVFGRDYLAGQILEDRVRALSKEPGKERLLVIGYGATSPLERLAAEVRETLHLADTSIAILGDRLAETTILTAIEKTDLRVIVVPFHLGFKHTGSMQLGREIESLLSRSNRTVAYDGRELLPDPLVARWLRRVASQYLTPRREDLGIVVMAHGAGEYHNERILKAVEPLRKRYNLEVAFGMADVETLQAAIDKVEARGARRIHVLRLYSISRALKAETEFVLGLTSTRGPMNHSGKGGPSRVRSGALLSTGGGFDDHPLIAEVLLQRVLEVSRDPDRETVILLGHGAGEDEEDQFWIEQMEKWAEFIRAKAPRRFRAIKVATVREDWPEKRERAVAQVRWMIEDAGRDGGRVLVISTRIAGAGPYRRFLAGLDYVLNDQGIAPHPNLTRWVEEQIETWIKTELASKGGTTKYTQVGT